MHRADLGRRDVRDHADRNPTTVLTRSRTLDRMPLEMSKGISMCLLPVPEVKSVTRRPLQ